MSGQKKPHISGIDKFARSNDYKYPRTVSPKFDTIYRDRVVHGNKILKDLNAIKDQFDSEKLMNNKMLRDDCIYVEFYSTWGYKLKLEQLHDNRKNENYLILNIKEELDDKNVKLKRYKVTVILKEGGISHFFKRLNNYQTQFSKNKEGEYTDKPLGNDLFANIEDIKIATLEAFWTDGVTNKFPDINEKVWWEVWFRKTQYIENEDVILSQIEESNLVLGQSKKLIFKEHVVRLIYGNAQDLSDSLLLLDSLAELRKPQVINDFVTHANISYSEEREWLDNLKKRTFVLPIEDETKIFVSVFDSGVNNKHPLLEDIISDNNLFSWNKEWGVADTEPNGGHGTGMSGLIIYGDLTDSLSSTQNINIYHGIESFKIYHPNSKTKPDLFGIIYLDGYNELSFHKPKNERIICLTVTNDGIIDSGRPSSSSAVIDNIAFGNANESANPQLIIVSGGNVSVEKETDFPSQNFLSSIQDPGQSYNALTVGAYTRKNLISDTSKYNPLAANGEMSPFNSTSAMWETQWPNKPDIVFEGGNAVSDGYFVSSHPELNPISLDKDFVSNLFIPFGGTSSATAFAAKMAADLKMLNPSYWPETIRALIVHSADWTDQMLVGKDLNREGDRRALVRSVGYGVPNFEKAAYSSKNTLTLVAQNFLQPYILKSSQVKTNKYHLYELPWPTSVLENELFDKNVKITITLSYFIEPNPGARQYANSFSYHSHSLDFKMIRPLESFKAFERRISADAVDLEEDQNMKDEEWVIKERVRSKGSLKKDFISTTGADLAQRNLIAIYPKGGWYKTRKKLEQYNSEIRYSLIVSIETDEVDVDIYSPVATMIENLAKIPSK